MVNENWPTYVLLAVYVILMTIVSIIANKQKRQDKGNMVVSHFLANKGFGTTMLFMTTFASIYSGYTVVGVPNEAGIRGFTTLGWAGAMIAICASFLILFPRLRRIGMARNYVSPGDFINDRYRSKSVKILVVICLCIPQLLYFAVQLHSIGSTLSAITSGELNFYWVIIIASVLIFIFEIIGGMRSVAYTDAIQATFMIIVFVIMPIMLSVIYGGYTGQIIDPNLFQNGQHCKSSNNNATGVWSGCVNYATQPVISNTFISEQYFLRKPSALTSINYLLFVVSLISFGLNPHILQRIFAAKKDENVKMTIMAVSLSPLLTVFSQTFLGITFLSNFPDLKPEYQKIGAFQAILAIFRDNGGFQAFMSYVALLAALAGIMSTADSALIGVSNTISVDIFQDWFLKNKSEKYIVYIGKIVSLIMIGISIGLACTMEAERVNTGRADYAIYLLIQQGILTQAFPAYALGLFTNIHKYSILVGLITGMISNSILIALKLTDNDPFAKLDPTLAALDSSWFAIAGVLFNLIFVGVTQLIISCKHRLHSIPDNDSDDNSSSKGTQSISQMNINPRFSGLLTLQEIRNIMKGVYEPITRYNGLFVWLAFIFSLIPVFHWIGPIDPELKERFGNKVNSFEYNGYYSRVIIMGLPGWVMISIVWIALGMIASMIAASLWTVNTKHESINDDKHVINNTDMDTINDDQIILSSNDGIKSTGFETETQDLL